MKLVNNYSFREPPNQNIFNVIQEQNIKNERKGLIMYIT
jgi:hypothetical protein